MCDITVATSIFYIDCNKDSARSVWAPYGGKGVPDSDIDWDDVCSALMVILLACYG